MARVVYPGIATTLDGVVHQRVAFGLENMSDFTDRQNTLAAQFIIHEFNDYLPNANDLWRYQSSLRSTNSDRILITPLSLCGRTWTDDWSYEARENREHGDLIVEGNKETDPNVQNRPFNWQFRQSGMTRCSYDYANAHFWFNSFTFSVHWNVSDVWPWSCDMRAYYYADPRVGAAFNRWYDAFGNDANFRLRLMYQSYQGFNDGNQEATIGANEGYEWREFAFNGDAAYNRTNTYYDPSYVALEQYSTSRGLWSRRCYTDTRSYTGHDAWVDGRGGDKWAGDATVNFHDLIF
ncbi:MAG: hypothetical protein IKQ43_11225 [Treponema sp.]|nr:hypothetical protein [Treponema sp.]